MSAQTQRETPVPHPDLLSVTEVARVLRISQQTVRDMYHYGKLLGVRIGNCTKLYANAVCALIQPQTPKVN